MPYKPLHPCGNPRCAALTKARYCVRHAKEDGGAYDRARGSAHQRGYGGKAWAALRRVVLARCHWTCEAEGCSQEATEVDHIVAKRGGGTDDPENLQGLCKSCHSRKTAREDRGRKGRSVG